MTDRYIAKSASDRTDDWPFWMVWDAEKGVNRTGDIARDLGFPCGNGAVFASAEEASIIAKLANERIVS